MKRVVSGLERWIGGGPGSVGLDRGARIGIVAHPASIDRAGRHAVELVLDGSDYELVRVFAPEHGLWGHEQDMETVVEAVDPISGLPVISLYGAAPESLRPKREHLEDLDAIVVDLQDVGSRYYTFVYTLSFVMEAAAEVGLPVVVLDRPNPIGGERIDGPVLDPALSSFVGRYPIPVQHGMTVVELALLFNSAFSIGCELRVVEMSGWRRGLRFEETGLPWVPPSPNMPTPTTARVYPGGCLVEGTNLSEGRGTTTPFELIGAPWIDAAALVDALRRASLPGVAFRTASFQPRFQKHAGTVCRGVQVIPTDLATFRPFSVYLLLLGQALRRSEAEFRWRTEAYEFETERLAIDLLLGRPDLRSRIEAATPLAEIEASWEAEARQFGAIRDGFLRYS